MSDTIAEEVTTDCLNVLLHVWDNLDSRLTPDATASMRAHLTVCKRCTEYQRFQECFLATLATLRTRQCAPWHVKARILDSLVTAGFAPS